MVVCSYQQLRHVRSSAIPPGFLSGGVCTHVSLCAWYGRASSLPLEKGMLGWSPPRPQHSRCQRLTRCRLFVQLFQQSQLLLLVLISQILGFQLSDTLGLVDFSKEVLLNCGFLFDLLFYNYSYNDCFPVTFLFGNLYNFPTLWYVMQIYLYCYSFLANFITLLSSHFIVLLILLIT